MFSLYLCGGVFVLLLGFAVKSFSLASSMPEWNFSHHPMFHIQGHGQWMIPPNIMQQWGMMGGHQQQFYGMNPTNFWLHNFASAGTCNKCSRNRTNTYYAPLTPVKGGRTRRVNLTRARVARASSPARRTTTSSDSPSNLQTDKGQPNKPSAAPLVGSGLDTPAVSLSPQTGGDSSDAALATENADAADNNADGEGGGNTAAPDLKRYTEPGVPNTHPQENPYTESGVPNTHPQENPYTESGVPNTHPQENPYTEPGVPNTHPQENPYTEPGVLNTHPQENPYTEPGVLNTHPQKPPEDFCSQEVKESDGESGVLCMDCAEGVIKAHARMGEGASMEEIQGFLTEVDKKSRLFKKRQSSIFKDFANTFCDSCKPVNVKKFIEYAERRARELQIPPEIMFSLLMKESSGACDTGPGENCPNYRPLLCNGTGNNTGRQAVIEEYNTACQDRGRADGSFGLFQLNLRHPWVCEYKVRNKCSLATLSDNDLQNACEGYSEKDSCTYGKGQTLNDDKCKLASSPKEAQQKGICLNNPYCSFEEAIHLLKRKLESKFVKAEGVTLPKNTQWTDMSPEQRDLFRNAVMAYNSSTALKGSYTYMKGKNSPTTAEMKEVTGMNGLSGWELQRMFLLNAAIHSAKARSQGKDDVIQSSGTKYRFPSGRQHWMDMLANLSYMEQITGREVDGGGKNSYVCQWRAYKDTVKDCNEERGGGGRGNRAVRAVEMPSYGSGSSHAVEMPGGSGSSHAVEMPSY